MKGRNKERSKKEMERGEREKRRNKGGKDVREG